MDRKSLTQPKSLPHWSGYQKDLAHYIHSTMIQAGESGPAKVEEVLQHVLQSDVIKTPIKVKNPKDRRRFIYPEATVIVLRVDNGQGEINLGV